MSNVVQFKGSTLSKTPETPSAKVDQTEAGTSTPSLTSKESIFAWSSGTPNDLHWALLTSSLFQDMHANQASVADADTERFAQIRRDSLISVRSALALSAANPKIRMVPVSRVSKLGGASVLLICCFSLMIWHLTGFAALSPFLAVLIGSAALVVLAMGLVLEMKESTQ